jgi:membrane protease subunit HflK
MSLNDPRWGDGNDGPDDDARRRDPRPGRPPQGEGPPDLEEVWRQFNERLAVLFGGGRGGRSSGPGGGRSWDGKQFGAGIVLLVAIVLVLWLLSGFYKVDANERAVVLRFGRYVETTEPGLRWRLPYPIERHEIVDLTGVRTVEIGYRGTDRNKVLRESLMLTDDENIVSIQFAVQYVLKSPEDYLFRDRAPDESVKQAAESAMREIVGKSKMDYVLYEGREDIAVRAQELMQTMLDRYRNGVQVVRVTLQNAQPPEQVQAAFDDAVKAGQDRERLRNEGEAYANAVIPRARGTAARLLEEANAYKGRIVEQATGDAARFTQIQQQYRQAPAITRERLYLETMQQIFTNTSKVLVDAPAHNNLMVLPLERLLTPSGGTTAPTYQGPSSGDGSAEAAAESTRKERDMTRQDLRNRERGSR